MLVFALSRVFCTSRVFVGLGDMYVYGGLIWFPIRGSCLSLSLIGDHI